MSECAERMAELESSAGACPAAGLPVNERAHSGRRGVGLIGLVLLALLTCFYGLAGGPSLGLHESINAVAARRAIESGDWLIPHLGDTPRIRKTPLGIWLIGLASLAFDGAGGSRPVTELTARLPSAAAGFLNVWAVCWLGSMLFGRRAGLIAGTICAGCVATALYAHNAQVDMVLTLFTTLSFAFFWRGTEVPRSGRVWMAAAYAAFALAMLAKGPLPLAIVVLPLFLYRFVTLPALESASSGPTSARLFLSGFVPACWGQLRRWQELWVLPGLVVFLVIFAPWPIGVALHVDNALALWRVEYLDRFTGELSDRSRPMWYYLPILLGFMVPFAVSLPEAVAAPFLRRFSRHRRPLAFGFTWAAVGTVFLSLAAFKRAHYLLPVLPAFCLLLAPVMDRLFFGEGPTNQRRIRAVCGAIPVILAGAAVAGWIVVGNRMPGVLGPFLTASAMAWLLWSGASVAYAVNRRRTSFILLNLGLPMLLLVSWPTIVRLTDSNNREPHALISALLSHGVTPQSEIIWAGKRSNPTVEFYSNYHTTPLLSALDVAGLGRRGRTNVNRELLDTMLAKAKDKLAQGKQTYLITTEAYYRLLRGHFDCKVVFRLSGYRDDPGDELVVITSRDGPLLSAPVSHLVPHDERLYARRNLDRGGGWGRWAR